jgi:PAS domain S-box-containing protein
MDADPVSQNQYQDTSSAVFQKIKRQKDESVFQLAQEISDKNIANETNDEKDERFLLQFYLFPLPTYIWKIIDDNMILIDINQAAMKFSGPKIKELLGHTASQLYFDMPHVLQWMNQCRKELHGVRKQFYMSLRTTGERKFLDASWVYFPPRYILFHVSDITDQKNEQTKLEQSVEKSRQKIERSNDHLKKLNRDLEKEVNSRKRTEELLQKEQNRINYLLENLPAIVFLISQDQKIFYANHYFKKYIGDNHMSSYCYEIMYCDIEQCRDCIVKKVIKTGELQTKEWQSQSGNFFAMYYYPFNNDNNEANVLCLGIDITDRKKMEKQSLQARQLAEQSSLFKSQFLARMSHEIRTPMNGVLAMTDLLLNTHVSPEQKEYLQTLKNSGEMLLTIINDILDISKIEAGKLELNKRPFHLKSLIDEIYQLLLPKAQEKNIHFSYNIQQDMHDVYTSDPIRIRQILFNLIGNAIKFTDNGFVKIIIEPKEIQDEHTGILFEIKDTGPGIPQEHHEKVFHNYTQVNVSQQNFQGTGLGLSICYHLVRMLNGKIWLESELNQGTSFFLYLNLQKSENNVPDLTKKTEQEIPLLPKLLQINILLVEDNPVNRQVFKFYMDKLGYSFDFSENGRNAIDQVNKKNYDLIFMDIMMPKMNGMQATKKIREILPENRQPFIVALTADAIIGKRELYLQEGFDDYCTKPFNLNKLKQIINQFVIGKNKKNLAFPVTETSEEVVFDWEHIQELKNELNENYYELIKLSLKEGPTIFESLQVAVEQLDFNKTRQYAHAMKSIINIFGSSSLSKQCKEMELAAIDQSEKCVQKTFQRFENDFYAFRDFLENQLNK